MNCARIQKVLDDEPRFQAIVSRRDQRISVKGTEHHYAPLTVAVGKALEGAGVDDTKCTREFILAFALRVSAGPLPVVSTEEKPSSAVKPKVPKVSKKAAVVQYPPSDVTAQAPSDAPEPVTVKCTPNPSAAPRPQIAVQEKLNQFIASGDMLRFQCCVAAGQLLAALYQLAEHDNQPGNEERKTLITTLVDKYEEMSKTYIQFSVKQIIRDRTEEQIKG